MTPFAFARAADAADAVRRGSEPFTRYLGGGTNLVDLMRETIERPQMLVDITGLSRTIEEVEGGGLRIGAAARNTSVAAHPTVRAQFPMLSRAIVAGGSAQIRKGAHSATREFGAQRRIVDADEHREPVERRRWDGPARSSLARWPLRRNALDAFLVRGVQRAQSRRLAQRSWPMRHMNPPFKAGLTHAL